VTIASAVECILAVQRPEPIFICYRSNSHS